MGNSDKRMDFYRQVFGGSWITQAIWVAAELGIADLLKNGPCSVEELSSETGSDSDALYRLLRALASAGVFTEEPRRRFALSPLAELLQTDVSGSQRAFATMMGSEFNAAWGELLHSVRTGVPGFYKRFGKRFFEYMTENPERHAIYDSAMAGIHGPETGPMLDAYDFGSFGCIADIGGGNGSTLAVILGRHPAVRGILFDLPSVADRARQTIPETGFAERIAIEGGDFFKSVPSGADAYLLRHVIHDWQDLEAISILTQCHKAMNPGGKVLIAEMVVPDRNEPGFGKWLDLMMLVVAGRERTKDEYGKILSEAGLRMTRIIPTTSDVSIIEAVREDKNGTWI
jgi:SAM-dependent methyltransferase